MRFTYFRLSKKFKYIAHLMVKKPKEWIRKHGKKEKEQRTLAFSGRLTARAEAEKGKGDFGTESVVHSLPQGPLFHSIFQQRANA